MIVTMTYDYFALLSPAANNANQSANMTDVIDEM